MKQVKYIVIRNYIELAKYDYNSQNVIVVVEGERDRKMLIDIIRSSDVEEILIESIENAFISAKDIKEAIDMALEVGVRIRTSDDSFSTDDVVDVPSMRYLLNSIVKLQKDSSGRKNSYPKDFSEVAISYISRDMTEIEACKILGVQRAQFYRLLKKFGVNRSKVIK